MKRNNNILVVGIIVALFAGVALGWLIYGKKAATAFDRQLELKTTMRNLWLEHNIWYRSHRIAIFFGDDKNLPYIVARVDQNARELGDALKPFYNEDAGNQFTALIREHNRLAVHEVFAAMRSGDEVALAKAKEKWLKNADDVASFLISINPHLPKDFMRDSIASHYGISITEGFNILSETSIDASDFDENNEVMLKAADIVSEGIIKQFPDKF